jgi:hypothetical protein
LATETHQVLKFNSQLFAIPVPEKKSDPAGKERPSENFATFASFSSKPYFIAFNTFSIKVFAI